MNKKIKKNIQGERIYLRLISEKDATAEYCNWLNDKEVGQYTEVRFERHNLKKLRQYIKDALNNRSTLFFAIVRKDQNKFIGTIKLGRIYWQHGFGTLALMIGDKESWGKGFATEAVNLLTDYAFQQLKLRKIIAGIYETNVASLKLFQKVGYLEEGRQEKQYLYNGEYIDCVQMVKFSSAK